MKTSSLTDTVTATAGVTVATVPIEQLLLPLQNVAIGVVSVLILRGFGWLAKKLGVK